MNKNPFLIILLLSSCYFISIEKGFCFDYEKYKTSSLLKINEGALKGAQSHTTGYEFYLDHYKVQIKLNEYPTKINDHTAKILKYYWKSFPDLLKEEYRSMYSFEVNLKEEGQKFILVFQEQLIPYLEKEIKLSDYVDLYVIFGVHDISNKNSIFLVNDFSAVKLKEDKKNK